MHPQVFAFSWQQLPNVSLRSKFIRQINWNTGFHQEVIHRKFYIFGVYFKNAKDLVGQAQ